MANEIKKNNKAKIHSIIVGKLGVFRKKNQKLNSLLEEARNFPSELLSSGDGSSYNCSVVHWAAYNNYPEVLDVFIENGCDINILNSAHDTPLHEALKTDNRKCAILLLENGANQSLKNKVCIFRMIALI